MEAFAICRAEKVSQGTETAAHNHNLRASKTKLENNVDYSSHIAIHRETVNSLFFAARMHLARAHFSCDAMNRFLSGFVGRRIESSRSYGFTN